MRPANSTVVWRAAAPSATLCAAAWTRVATHLPSSWWRTCATSGESRTIVRPTATRPRLAQSKIAQAAIRCRATLIGRAPCARHRLSGLASRRILPAPSACVAGNRPGGRPGSGVAQIVRPSRTSSPQATGQVQSRPDGDVVRPPEASRRLAAAPSRRGKNIRQDERPDDRDETRHRPGGVGRPRGDDEEGQGDPVAADRHPGQFGPGVLDPVPGRGRVGRPRVGGTPGPLRRSAGPAVRGDAGACAGAAAGRGRG